MDWHKHRAALWRKESLIPIKRLESIALTDLLGIDKQRQELLANTQAFLSEKRAEHALLWGARGTGKSSLIKAVFNHFSQDRLRIIELIREDAYSLPELAATIEEEPYKFIVFCDELVFQTDSNAYRALRIFLQGSIALPPPNMLLYATSNLRYILPHELSDNHQLDPHYGEKIEDSLALADRFGLWLSFYAPSKVHYLRKIEQALSSQIRKGLYDTTGLQDAALEFSRLRATCNYRTADQFIRFVQRGGLEKG